MAKQQMSAGSINAAIAASRFFFTVTLERPDLVLPLTTVNKPRQGVLQTISFRANALNSRGIVGSGNPGWFAPTSWWSGGDSNFGLSGMRSWMSGNLSVSLKAKDSISRIPGYEVEIRQRARSSIPSSRRAPSPRLWCMDTLPSREVIVLEVR